MSKLIRMWASRQMLIIASATRAGTALQFPDYYTRLERLEAEADAYWASRR